MPEEKENKQNKVNRRRIGGLSSLLVSPGLLLFFLICAIIANFVGAQLPAILFLFFFLFGLCSRFWGLSALKHVKLTIDGDSFRMNAGQTATFRYTVCNDKLLPMVWLEVRQALPMNDSVIPVSGFERIKLSYLETGFGLEEKSQYRKRMVFIMGYQNISWDSVWRAERRGVYQFDEIYLRAGDGFGLTQSEQTLSISNMPTLVVYPRYVEVKTEKFLRNLWSGQTGNHGYIEDVTVLKNTKEYQPGDIWKRIDWRQVARTGNLEVKQFETIAPRTIHFVVDAESFIGHAEEMEEVLSILASLMSELHQLGMRCGISLPKTQGQGSVDILADDQENSLDDVLFQLAAFQNDTATSVFSDGIIQSVQNTVGQLYFVFYSEESVCCESLLGGLHSNRYNALVWDSEAHGKTLRLNCNISPIRDLKRGASK